MNKDKLKVIHVSSEVAPFSKSGGLADVAASLPKALAEHGHEVVVVSPFYGSIRLFESNGYWNAAKIQINSRTFPVVFAEHKHETERLKYVFVKCDELFDRPGYYNDPITNRDYEDNDVRFALLACAALTWCQSNDWRPDIVHGHDWQSGGLPLFIRSPRFNGFFDSSRFVFTIHNMAFQGRLHGGSRAWYDHAEDYAELGGPAEFHGMFNLLKLAIEMADAINTVSPTYAHELRTVEHMGFGLSSLLHNRHAHFSGILNGLDTTVWNPETDAALAVTYNSTTLVARNRNKRALCEHCSFDYKQSTPLVGMVTRISEQKGFGILLPIIGEIISAPAQVVILGSGDPDYESKLRVLERAYPNRIRLITEYNEPLSHLIYGGCDIFLMPSLFEPCGLSQMMALRYGAPPVARETGGLADTISDFHHNPRGGTGFLFREYSSHALSLTLKKAFSAFRNTEKWRRIQRNGMKEDFSWRRSARVYEEMYRRVLSSERSYR